MPGNRWKDISLRSLPTSSRIIFAGKAGGLPCRWRRAARMGAVGTRRAALGRPAASCGVAERKTLEEASLVAATREQIAAWRRRGDWQKIQCVELLFVRGWPNKEVALRLGISEQTVANHKFEFLAKLRNSVRDQGLPEEVFPELYEKEG